MSLIKVDKKEYREGSKAVFETVIRVFSITVFRSKEITTNNSIVDSLTEIKELTRIKGFKNEIKD